jgi:hypothetical protein
MVFRMARSLKGFKKRYHIKEYVNHSEAGTAQVDKPENIRQMQVFAKKIRAELNFDETEFVTPRYKGSLGQPDARAEFRLFGSGDSEYRF